MSSTRIWARKQIKRFKALIGLDFFAAPQMRCRKEKHGSDTCSWVICPDKIHIDSVVYSFGIGEDASFENSIINKYCLDVHAFDPTPKSIQWVKRQEFSEKFKMYEFGLSDKNGQVEFALPRNPSHVSGSILLAEHTGHEMISVEVRRLINIMQERGHTKIDILKMDIEGAEYDVIDSIIADKIEVEQILIEFHHRFSGVGVNKTYEALEKLYRLGYRIFNVSDNLEEISLIKG